MVTMADIETKANACSYSEFRSDIIWFIHDCHIVHKSDDTILGACTELEKAVDNEIFCAKDCTECYEMYFRDPKTFTMACSKNHKLIWAKSTDFCYFPAKLMRELSDGTVPVRYFGDVLADRLTTEFICDYSAKSPDGGSPIELYTIALNVSSQSTCVSFLFFYTSFY